MKHIKTFENYFSEDNLNKLKSTHGEEFVDMIKTSAAYKKYTATQTKTKKNITVSNITKKDISDIIGDVYDYIDLRDVNKDESVEHIFDIFMDIKNANPLVLYRVLVVESEDDINKDDVGRHYVMDKMMVDGDLFLSAGIGENHEKDSSELKYFVLTVIANKKDIDIEFMIRTNTGFNEAEVTLKKGSKVEIIEIEELEL
jgi:hypothetical protein